MLLARVVAAPSGKAAGGAVRATGNGIQNRGGRSKTPKSRKFAFSLPAGLRKQTIGTQPPIPSGAVCRLLGQFELSGGPGEAFLRNDHSVLR
jgi:hypothetical protein